MAELIRRELDRRETPTKFIVYDASTYGGSALKRNFISYIADQLGFPRKDYSRFHEGLYESRQTTDVNVKDLGTLMGTAVFAAVLVYVSFLVVSLLLVGLSSVATDKNFFGQIADSLPSVLGSTAFVSLLAGLFALLTKGASTERNQSEPSSDEEFSQRFSQLMKLGMKKKGFKRLIVFVDELDRCSPEDVVATLTAIRTFLDVRPCVFVVAADRAVLEQSLEELPQAIPSDEQNPYYSSASEYFDKVFHDRISLPPLRRQRLYEWAYLEVKGRGGIWGELREQRGDSELRRLLYVLVPSHVVSPRRVRTLLNGFVRSVVVAERRGFDWESRVEEIAKIVVLDTEFPSLGQDIRLDPRLPRLILDPPNDPPLRLARLLKKHGAYREATAGPEGVVDVEEEAADPIISEPEAVTSTDGENDIAARMVEAGHESLRRYLVRTRSVRTPKDLLYLDTAGAAVGMDDPTLGDVLDFAIDDPQTVIEAFRGESPQNQRQGILVLAGSLNEEFDQERKSVFTALVGIVESMDQDLAELSREISGHILGYARDEGLRSEELPVVLSLSLSGKNHELQEFVFDHPDLLSDEQRIGEVARMLPEIPSERRDRVYQALEGRLQAGRSELFLELIETLPETDAVAMLSSRNIYNGLFESLSNEEVDLGERKEFAVSSIQRAVDRDDDLVVARKLFAFFVREELFLEPIQSQALEVVQSISDIESRDEQVLMLMARTTGDGVKFWSKQLSDGKNATEDLGNLASQIASSQLDESLEEPDLTSDRVEVVGTLVPFVTKAKDERTSKVAVSLRNQLGSREWWASKETRVIQEEVHKLTLEIVDQIPRLSDELLPELANDVLRACHLLRDPAIPAATIEIVLDGVQEMGGGLRSSALDVLAEIPSPSEEATEELATSTIYARVALMRAAYEAGASIEPDDDVENIVRCAAARKGDSRIAAVTDWLALDPGTKPVIEVLRATTRKKRPAVRKALTAWASSKSDDDVTDLAVSLVPLGEDMQTWLEAVMEEGVDEDSLVDAFAQAIENESRGDGRKSLSAVLGTLGTTVPSAQKKVANIIVSLLETGKQVDFAAATKAIPALGRGHRSAGRLKEKFAKAAQRHGHYLSERQVAQLAECGVKVPSSAVKKKSLASRAKDMLKR